jgi:hopanoid biosynthesis associated protein HpnK
MVTGAAFEDAVRLAYAAPTLSVGLHLVVTNGRSVLPHCEIPHLVDGDGCFFQSLLRAGLHYFFDCVVQRELEREISAQFERFAATGLPLSHVDVHQHLLVHPIVFDLVLPLVEQYGANGIRLPRDDLWLALRYDRHRIAAKIVLAIVLGLMCRWCTYRLCGHRVVVADRVYGVLQSGQMHEAYVLEVLRHLRGPMTELYFHPSLIEQGEAMGPNPGDLATLLSPALRHAISDHGLCLTTYPALAGAR